LKPSEVTPVTRTLRQRFGQLIWVGYLFHSEFALAHAGLADAYGLLAFYGELDPVEAMPRARSAAEKALELDDSLAETHNAVAFISWLDWNWGRARQGFLRAIELNPSYAPARNLYGQYLLFVEGRAEEAVIELERTVELDPYNAHALAILGRTLISADRMTDALEALRHAKELNPELFHPVACLVRLHVRRSLGAQAVAEAETLVEIVGRNSRTLNSLATALVADGRLVEAEEVLKELTSLSTLRYVNPILLAHTSEAVGRREDAFQWLDRAYRERDPALAQWLSSVFWNSDIVDDPRFRELRRRVGLE